MKKPINNGELFLLRGRHAAALAHPPRLLPSRRASASTPRSRRRCGWSSPRPTPRWPRTSWWAPQIPAPLSPPPYLSSSPGSPVSTPSRAGVGRQQGLEAAGIPSGGGEGEYQVRLEALLAAWWHMLGVPKGSCWCWRGPGTGDSQPGMVPGSRMKAQRDLSGVLL